MRTLQLTEEEVATIKEALSIAEKVYADIFEDIMRRTVVIRHNENSYNEKTKALEYHDKSWEFAKLAIEINDKDV